MAKKPTFRTDRSYRPGAPLPSSSMHSSPSVLLLSVRRRSRTAALCLAVIGLIIITLLHGDQVKHSSSPTKGSDPRLAKYLEYVTPWARPKPTQTPKHPPPALVTEGRDVTTPIQLRKARFAFVASKLGRTPRAFHCREMLIICLHNGISSRCIYVASHPINEERKIKSTILVKLLGTED